MANFPNALVIPLDPYGNLEEPTWETYVIVRLPDDTQATDLIAMSKILRGIKLVRDKDGEVDKDATGKAILAALAPYSILDISYASGLTWCAVG